MFYILVYSSDRINGIVLSKDSRPIEKNFVGSPRFTLKIN